MKFCEKVPCFEFVEFSQLFTIKLKILNFRSKQNMYMHPPTAYNVCNVNASMKPKMQMMQIIYTVHYGC